MLKFSFKSTMILKVSKTVTIHIPSRHRIQLLLYFWDFLTLQLLDSHKYSGNLTCSLLIWCQSFYYISLNSIANAVRHENTGQRLRLQLKRKAKIFLKLSHWKYLRKNESDKALVEVDIPLHFQVALITTKSFFFEFVLLLYVLLGTLHRLIAVDRCEIKFFLYLTLSRRRSLSYRIQSIDLLCKFSFSVYT